jgi:hypothetical protein
MFLWDICGRDEGAPLDSREPLSQQTIAWRKLLHGTFITLVILVHSSLVVTNN